MRGVNKIMRDLTKSAQSLSDKASKTFVQAIDKVEKSSLLLQQAIEKAENENSKDTLKIEEIQQQIQSRESANEERRNMILNNEGFIKNLRSIIQ